MLSTTVSRFAALPFNITLTLVPIIIGGLTLGIGAGAFLGLVFGVIVMVLGLSGFDPSCAPLIMSNVFFFIFLCIIKGTLAGLAAGLIGKLIKNNKYIAAITAGVAAPVVNTGTFLLGMRVFFYDLLCQWAGDTAIIYYMVVGLCGINFLIELGTNLILSPAVVRIIHAVTRRR